MGIGLFRRPYTVRRYSSQQTFKQGYACFDYVDTISSLNVQPLTSDDLQALPEGERVIRRIKSYSDDCFTAADEATGTPGDRLRYKGKWYECVSSVEWNHTPLRHFHTEFVILPEGEQKDHL